MRFAIMIFIGSTVTAAAEPVPYNSLPNAFWRGNHGNVLECMSHQIDKDIIRMREAGVQTPMNRFMLMTSQLTCLLAQ